MLPKGKNRKKKGGIDCRRRDDFTFVERSEARNGVAFNFLIKQFGEYCFKRSTHRKLSHPIATVFIIMNDENKLAVNASLKFSDTYCDSHNYYSSDYKQYHLFLFLCWCYAIEH